MKKISVMSPLLILVFSILATGCGNADSDFPKVTKPYHSDQAIYNGDVVNVHGKYSNIEKWQTFLKNLESNNPDKVRITQYTIEGDPIFYELSYDGELISYTFDNSMDAYGSDLKRPSTKCKGIDLKTTENERQVFVLRGCDNTKTGDTFWFEESPIAANSITQSEAEQIALKCVAERNESSYWTMEGAEEEDNYWIVRFGPKREMPELLWLHIDKKTGDIIKVITDS